LVPIPDQLPSPLICSSHRALSIEQLTGRACLPSAFVPGLHELVGVLVTRSTHPVVETIRQPWIAWVMMSHRPGWWRRSSPQIPRPQPSPWHPDQCAVTSAPSPPLSGGQLDLCRHPGSSSSKQIRVSGSAPRQLIHHPLAHRSRLTRPCPGGSVLTSPTSTTRLVHRPPLAARAPSWRHDRHEPTSYGHISGPIPSSF